MNDLILQISYALTIKKRTNPDNYDSTVFVRREGDVICIESLNDAVSIELSIEELRAIMRLFDVPQSE